MRALSSLLVSHSVFEPGVRQQTKEMAQSLKMSTSNLHQEVRHTLQSVPGMYRTEAGARRLMVCSDQMQSKFFKWCDYIQSQFASFALGDTCDVNYATQIRKICLC